MAFDMGRMMGAGARQKYDVAINGFAKKLHDKLQQIKPLLEPMISSSIFNANIDKISNNISQAYEILANGGQDGLNAQGNDFHVGATKLLHFINPELFMIIDSNTAAALRNNFKSPYKNTAQPGYSSAKYIQSLTAIKTVLVDYGEKQFRSLEPATPSMRIFDKIAFAHNAFDI